VDAGNKELTREAMRVVANELGRSRISKKEYLDWFTRTLARQVAAMHSKGWSHANLSEHNITLDCRIKDLESINGIRGYAHPSRDYHARAIERDKDWADRAAAIVAENIGLKFDRPAFEEEYAKAYKKPARLLIAKAE